MAGGPAPPSQQPGTDSESAEQQPLLEGEATGQQGGSGSSGATSFLANAMRPKDGYTRLPVADDSSDSQLTAEAAAGQAAGAALGAPAEQQQQQQRGQTSCDEKCSPPLLKTATSDAPVCRICLVRTTCCGVLCCAACKQVNLSSSLPTHSSALRTSTARSDFVHAHHASAHPLTTAAHAFEPFLSVSTLQSTPSTDTPSTTISKHHPLNNHFQGTTPTKSPTHQRTVPNTTLTQHPCPTTNTYRLRKRTTPPPSRPPAAAPARSAGPTPAASSAGSTRRAT